MCRHHPIGLVSSLKRYGQMTVASICKGKTCQNLEPRPKLTQTKALEKRYNERTTLKSDSKLIVNLKRDQTE